MASMEDNLMEGLSGLNTSTPYTTWDTMDTNNICKHVCNAAIWDTRNFTQCKDRSYLIFNVGTNLYILWYIRNQ